MTITEIAALVTIITGPLTMLGVVAVFMQLKAMREERRLAESEITADMRRRAAKILPHLETLRSSLENGWGVEIVDHRVLPQDEEPIEFLRDTVESDIHYSAELRSRCADIGIEQSIMASLVEVDLKTLRYYLRDIASAGDHKDRWEYRWPQLCRACHRAWERLRLLEESIPEFATSIGELTPAGYRMTIAHDSRNAGHAHADRFIRGETDWPPIDSTVQRSLFVDKTPPSP